MNEHLEIEYKILLDANIYQQIVTDLKDQIKDHYVQVNYYLMHPILETNKSMLRIREKKHQYELTLKRPKKIGNLETNIDISRQMMQDIFDKKDVDNEIFQILSTYGIKITDLDMTHYLKTERYDIETSEGVISLDKNEYNGIIDYELEYEVDDPINGKQAFLDLISNYQLSYESNCPTKIKRMRDSL